MMTYRYITLAAVALTLAACSQDEDFAPQNDSDAVRINATIGTMLQTRLAYDDVTGETTFESGDQIQVANTKRTTKNKATYTYNGSSWSTTETLVWNGSSTNQFEAYYPVTEGTSFKAFTLSTVQNTGELLAAADWMTIRTNEMEKPSDKTLKLNFDHMLTKVTVRFYKWNDEFSNPKAVEITEPKIYSKGTAITAAYSQDATTGATTATITSEGESTGISPMEGETNSMLTFTAIVAPDTYLASDKFMTFNIDEEPFTVLAKSTEFTDGLHLQPGCYYTFDLTVGKDNVEITGVNVTPWTEKDIDGGVITVE